MKNLKAYDIMIIAIAKILQIIQISINSYCSKIIFVIINYNKRYNNSYIIKKIVTNKTCMTELKVCLSYFPYSDSNPLRAVAEDRTEGMGHVVAIGISS